MEHISLYSFALGNVFGVSVAVLFFDIFVYPLSIFWIQISWFFAAVSIFHLSEYLFAYYNHGFVSHYAFLLNNPAYNVAMIFALFESLLERNASFKSLNVTYIGVCLMIVGEVVRKLALFHAGRNFTHDMKKRKVESHTLVTRGIYQYVRHPGYCGWFLWCIGSQVVLCNPVMFVAFAVVAWVFFSVRIHVSFEEQYLASFFKEYQEYKVKVPFSGVPFATSYPVHPYLSENVVKMMLK